LPSANALLDKKKYLLKSFEGAISYKFKDMGMLLLSLTHKSFSGTNSHKTLENNERLEFLGDAVLQVAVSDLLVARFPNYNEGELSKIRASMVNRHTLSMIAQNLEIGRYLLIGKSINRKMLNGISNSLLADALEAVIGAVYLDGGFEKAKKFVESLFDEHWDDVESQKLNRDFKSMIQELSQKRYGTAPKYELIGEFGNNHNKTFEIELQIEEGISARGIGHNKKDAEQEAAKKAWELMEIDKH